MAEERKSEPYKQVIDLTSRAIKQDREEATRDAFAEPDPPLPDVQLEDLSDSMRQAVERMNWPGLMPVQQKAIPYLLERRDLIVQSRTGSGKTGAFMLPLLDLLDPSQAVTQALVLAPTRELARQVEAEFERMNGPDSAIRTALVYGGVRYGPQLQALKEGAHVVIGTPGRILDHLERKTLDLRSLRVLVFDEADEMLSMGFFPAMKQLRRYLPRERTTFMFSATIPHRVQSLAQEFMNDPGFLSLSVGKVSVDAIEHRYHVVDAMEKDRALARILEMENPDSAIIFCNTKRDVEYLATFLRNFGYNADEISGDLSQRAREAVMDRIRRNELRILVATDVAARGIDISDLSHVIMYDVPQDQEYYVHRAGRTARAGKAGIAIVLATRGDERTLLSITRLYGIDIEKKPVPTDEDVSARVAERATVMLEDRRRVLSNLQKERARRFLPLIKDLAEEEPEILAALVDSIYHESLHQTSGPEVEPPERLEKPASPRGGDGGRRKGRRRK